MGSVTGLLCVKFTDCDQQRVFEEAEASFRSQIQLLEEDLAREKVDISFLVTQIANSPM